MAVPKQFEELLDFTVEPDQLFFEKRAYIRYDADRDEYKSDFTGRTDKIVIEWKNKGFILGPTSTLNFDLKLDGAESFGVGKAVVNGALFRGESAATIFARARLFVADQVVLDEDFLHRRIDIVDRWSCSPEYLEQTGQMMGYDDEGVFEGGQETRFNSDLTDDPTSNVSSVRSVSIPLHHLLDFFSQHRLFPSTLVRGSMRLELDLLPVLEAVVSTNAAAQGDEVLTVSRARLYFDEMIPRPMIMSQLLEAEQTIGLEYPFTSYIGKQFKIAASSPGRHFFDFPEAASRAIMFFVRASQSTDDTTQTNESAKAGLKYTQFINSWRVRLGKLYLPANSGVDNVAKAMAQGLMAFNNLVSCSRPPAVNIDQFIGVDLANRSAHVMAVSLSREDVSADGASGELIRFDKGLTFEVDLKNVAEPINLTGYLLHEKLMKIQGGVVLMSS